MRKLSFIKIMFLWVALFSLCACNKQPLPEYLPEGQIAFSGGYSSDIYILDIKSGKINNLRICPKIT
jgi:hypothetical protein